MKKIKAYTCGVNWEYECEDALDGVTFYNDIEHLKDKRKCWKQCGIVELEISLVAWVEPENFFNEEKN